MAEYIPKQAAIDAMKQLPHEHGTKEQRARTGGIAACQMVVRNLEPADVRPVVRGRWIPDEIAAYDRDQVKKGWVPWLRSECGWCVGKHQTAFCPSCGADMRGGDSE